MSELKSANPFDQITGPSPETMSSVLDLLEVTKAPLRKAHAHFLSAAVVAFEVSRAWKQVFGTDHKALGEVRKLGELLSKIDLSMQDTRLDIKAMICHLEDPQYSTADWNTLVGGLRKLAEVLAKSKTARLPARLRDAQLDQAIAFLMLRIRDATGSLARARAADARFDRPARLASKEAEAIWMLLRHIDEITENVVANRIIALNRRHGDRLEEAFPHYIFIGSKVRHLRAKD